MGSKLGPPDFCLRVIPDRAGRKSQEKGNPTGSDPAKPWFEGMKSGKHLRRKFPAYSRPLAQITRSTRDRISECTLRRTNLVAFLYFFRISNALPKTKDAEPMGSKPILLAAKLIPSLPLSK
jgi:hypothetical protein